MLRRRDFGDIHRSYDGRDADAQASDDARNNEHDNAGRQRRADCAHKIENADPEQRGFASETVRRPATEQGTDDGSIERRGHRDAVQFGAETPKRLNSFFGAGDDDGVESKEKSGERGSKRPEEDA